MSYKDKDKQREADKERQRRYRDWKASGGVTKGVTDSGCDKEGVTEVMKDKGRTLVVSDAEHARLMALNAPERTYENSVLCVPIDKQDVKDELDLKPNEIFNACKKRLPECTAQGNIRVSKPGDADYKSWALSRDDYESKSEKTQIFIR